MKKYNARYLLICSSVALFACAGQKPPVEAMTRADMTVKRLDQTKAAEAAPLEMRLAHEKLDQAKKDMDQKNYTEAKNNAEDATVQAELAESKTNLKDVNSKITEAQQGLKTLKNEVQHHDESSSK